MHRKHAILCHAVPAGIRRGLTVAVACAALALATFAPCAASACSTLGPEPALRGYPSDGELEVPTDVVPFYDSSSLFGLDLANAQFTLTSSTGDTIAARGANTQLYSVDLTIAKALQPNTSYTLVAKLPTVSNAGDELVQTLTFTTGAGPVAAPPDPPEGFLQHYQFGQPLLSSCSPWAQGTCVAVSEGLAVEETNVDEFGQEFPPEYLHREPWFTNLSGINQGTNFRCVKLRTRAANAIYSSPTVLCGADAPLLTIRGSETIACTSHGITQDGALLASSAAGPDDGPAAANLPAEASAGCSLAVHHRSPANAVLGALFALALAARLGRGVRRCARSGGRGCPAPPSD